MCVFLNRKLCEIEFLNFPWAIRPNFRYLDPDPMRIWILSSKIHANCYYTVDHEKQNRTKGNNKKKKTTVDNSNSYLPLT